MMVGLCNLPHDGNNFVLLERFDVFGIMVRICDSLPRECLTMAFSKSLCLFFSPSLNLWFVQCNKVSSVLQPLATHIIALQPMMFLPVAPHSQWDSWAHQLSLMWKLLFILLFIYYLHESVKKVLLTSFLEDALLFHPILAVYWPLLESLLDYNPIVEATNKNKLDYGIILLS